MLVVQYASENQAVLALRMHKTVPQATSHSLVFSPPPSDFRLLRLGSPSTNLVFGCLG